MKKIYTKQFPVKGFTALTIYQFVFIRKDCIRQFTEKLERHEMTHAKQQIEMTIAGVMLALSLWLFGCGWYSFIPVGLFLEWYCIEWIIKIPFCGFNCKKAYFSISFELEAYDHQDEIYYNEVRRHYAWLRYLFTIK